MSLRAWVPSTSKIVIGRFQDRDRVRVSRFPRGKRQNIEMLPDNLRRLSSRPHPAVGIPDGTIDRLERATVQLFYALGTRDVPAAA